MAQNPENTGENNDRGRIKSAETAFHIVEAVAEMDGAGVSELADYMDIPKSTAHVYLKTLTQSDYLVRREEKYHVSFQFLRIGGVQRYRTRLFQVAKPELGSMAGRTGELIDLGIEENGQAVLLFKAEAPESVDDNAPIGSYVAMHATAMGKAMLAFFPDEKVANIIGKRGLQRKTPNTITDPDSLMNELKEIRDREVAFNFEERTPGVRAVATPVLGKNENIIGAISISGPTARMGEDRMKGELMNIILESRNIIELKIRHY